MKYFWIVEVLLALKRLKYIKNYGIDDLVPSAPYGCVIICYPDPNHIYSVTELKS